MDRVSKSTDRAVNIGLELKQHLLWVLQPLISQPQALPLIAAQGMHMHSK